jgi:hypothetical protein
MCSKEPDNEKQNDRPNNIELLFNGQRPIMLQEWGSYTLAKIIDL